MTWTFKFDPHPDKETIGTLTATWNEGQVDAFVFSRSVNCDSPESMADFKASAEKTLEEQTKPAMCQAALSALDAEMNK